MERIAEQKLISEYGYAPGQMAYDESRVFMEQQNYRSDNNLIIKDHHSIGGGDLQRSYGAGGLNMSRGSGGGFGNHHGGNESFNNNSPGGRGS